MKKASFFKLLNYWPPYIGAGIRVTEISPDFKLIQVEMKHRFWNKNYVGTHFGGSLYSMTDPFYMLMLMMNLGEEYIVWDKAAKISFKKPGRSKVTALFRLSDEEILNIKTKADLQGKVEPIFHVHVHDDSGLLVAEVEKTLYVRKKTFSSV